MTNVYGRLFISYSREHATDIENLVCALSAHGIPTWQDTQDLALKQTEEEIRSILKGSGVSGALLVVTNEVEKSGMIKRVEAPEAVARSEIDSDFILIIVAADGLKYEDIDSILNGHIGMNKLSNRNMLKAELADQPDILKICQRALKERLNLIHKQLADNSNLTIQVSVSRKLATRDDLALSIDWSRHFNGRHASKDLWVNMLLPSLQQVSTTVEQEAPGRGIDFSGNPTLSVAFSIGIEFMETRGINITWKQFTPGGPILNLSLTNQRAPGNLTARTKPLDVNGNDIALLVSITADVENDCARILQSLPSLRGAVHVANFQGNRVQPERALTPGEATDAAYVIIDALRDSRRQFNTNGTIHIFLAAPVGLAMMIGQLMNTFAKVIVYEHTPDKALPYAPEITLCPDAHH